MRALADAYFQRLAGPPEKLDQQAAAPVLRLEKNGAGLIVVLEQSPARASAHSARKFFDIVLDLHQDVDGARQTAMGASERAAVDRMQLPGRLADIAGLPAACRRAGIAPMKSVVAMKLVSASPQDRKSVV